MKTLITGGAGFIGSHLADLLIASGHEVVVIDNLSNGRKSNIEHLLKKKNFIFHKLDITNMDDIEPIFVNVDWVFHLAGMADIVPSIESPKEYYDCNVTGTFNIVEASRKAGVKKIVYAASSSSYGIPDNYPTAETADIRPQYPYALTKYMGEELVMHWSQTYNIPSIVLRLFNVYGPRSRTTGAYGAVFGVFLSQKIHNKPYTVVGDGTQTRDFTYVTDVAAAFLRAAETTTTSVALNVGSDNHYSVNRLVELLEGEVTYVPKRPGEPDCTYADTTRIHEVLNWKTKVSFEDGVAEMLTHLDDWKDAPVWEPDTIKQATKVWFEYLGDGG
jgi:UDP-glucose 4-epimerase